MSAFEISIESSAGVQQGPGPVVTAQDWQQTAILNGSGSGSFTMPAADSRAALATPRRVARARTLLGGAVHDFGAIIIDSINTSEDFVGGATLAVQGNDLFDELAGRIVPALTLDDGAGGPTDDPFTDLLTYASGWSMDAVNGYATTGATGVLLTLADETVLAALVKIAELTGESFRLGVGRKIVWLRDLTASAVSANVRLINGGSGHELSGNDDVAIITELSVETNTHDLFTYIYPRGAGDGDARLTLDETTRFSAAGAGNYTSGDYTLHIDADPLESYIKRDTAVTAYGQIERAVTYSEITPATTAAADVEAAANQLFDAALAELKQHSAPQAIYSIACTKLEKQVLPGQTVFVSYRGMAGDYLYVDIEDTFLVLEATTQLDQQGVRTTGLVIGALSGAQRVQGDREVLADTVQQVQALMAHAQPGTSAGAVTDATVPHTDTANTFTQTQTITNANALVLNTATVQNRGIFAQTAGSNRWILYLANNVAESGSNAGSNIEVRARSDAGADLGVAWTITRSTRRTTLVGLTTTADIIAGGYVKMNGGNAGTFTCGAAATTAVANTNITASSRIQITATNAAAANLMAGAKALYISARTAGTSFTVATADGTAAAGTETFDYFIVN
jgi:hypothetical protein